MLGERWKELTDKEKGPYEKKAKDDKARYEKEKAAYANVSSLVSQEQARPNSPAAGR
jgi:hypothetical protein